MDTRRYGKAMTVVRGLESKPDEAEKLARDLKKGLATGGFGKRGGIVLPGDHRKKGGGVLPSKGYKARGRRPLFTTPSIRPPRPGGTPEAGILPPLRGAQ